MNTFPLCKNCINFLKDFAEDPCHDCHREFMISRKKPYYEGVPETNQDRIRRLSDEGLAEFFASLPCCPPGVDLEEICFPNESCGGTDLRPKCWFKWLHQKVDEGVFPSEKGCTDTTPSTLNATD